MYFASCIHTDQRLLEDTSLLVATRSHLLPSEYPEHTLENPVGLDLSLDITQSTLSSDILAPSEWELWGEDSNVNLCEVHLHITPSAFSEFSLILYLRPVSSNRRYFLDLVVRPLPPITCLDRHVTDLSFFPGYSPASFVSASKEQTSIDEHKEFRKRGMYLCASCIDFGDCKCLYPTYDVHTNLLCR